MVKMLINRKDRVREREREREIPECSHENKGILDMHFVAYQVILTGILTGSKY